MIRHNGKFFCFSVAATICLLSPPRTALLAVLKEGSPAPDWELVDLSGELHRRASVPQEIEILLFGELHHANTIAAFKDVQQILKAPPIDRLKARVYLIIGSNDPLEKLGSLLTAAKLDPTPPILRDVKLRAFENYDVKVLPSLFLINSAGEITLSLSGFPADFVELVSEGILSTAKIASRKSSQSAKGTSSEGPVSLENLEAYRSWRLAKGFERRRLHLLAKQHYEAAIRLNPRLAEAKLGLAGLEFSLGDLQGAEAHYQEILAAEPTSLEAALGLVKIEISRHQLEAARERIQKQIAAFPLEARCYFLLGQIEERQGKKEEALAAYKKTAVLLLDEREPLGLLRTEFKE